VLHQAKQSIDTGLLSKVISPLSAKVRNLLFFAMMGSDERELSSEDCVATVAVMLDSLMTATGANVTE
jgi:hypothetical protein